MIHRLSLTPWNVDLYCNSIPGFDYEVCNKSWFAYLFWQRQLFHKFSVFNPLKCRLVLQFYFRFLIIWALQQTLTCYLFTLTRQLFHKFLHSVLREYYIWNKIIIQAQNLQNPIFCIWESILLMDKNTMCMIMLWNPTNFEAIFLLKICNRLKVR